MHHVDGDLVLLPVGRGGHQARAETGIGGGIAASRGGAGHRLGPHDVAAAGHQQLRAGAQEPVDVEQEAPWVGGSEPGQEGGTVDVQVGLDHHLPGQHHLAQAVRSGLPHLLGGPRHQLAPPLRRARRSDGEGAGRAGGTLGWGGTERGDVYGGRVGGTHRGDPAGAVVGSSPHHLRDHEHGVSIALERQGAEGHRTGPWAAHLVVRFDVRQALVHVAQRDREGYATPGQADA